MSKKEEPIITSSKLDFFQLPNKFIQNPNYSINVKVTYSYLLSYCYGGSSTAFPSIRTIAAHLGKDKNTVTKMLEDLIKVGGIKKLNRITKSGKKTSNEYKLADLNFKTGEFEPFTDEELKVYGNNKKVGVAGEKGKTVSAKKKTVNFNNPRKGKKLTNDKNVNDLEKAKDALAKPQGASISKNENIKIINTSISHEDTKSNTTSIDDIYNEDIIDQYVKDNQVSVEDVISNHELMVADEKINSEVKRLKQNIKNYTELINEFKAVGRNVSEHVNTLNNFKSKLNEIYEKYDVKGELKHD